MVYAPAARGVHSRQNCNDLSYCRHTAGPGGLISSAWAPMRSYILITQMHNETLAPPLNEESLNIEAKIPSNRQIGLNLIYRSGSQTGTPDLIPQKCCSVIMPPSNTFASIEPRRLGMGSWWNGVQGPAAHSRRENPISSMTTIPTPSCRTVF